MSPSQILFHHRLFAGVSGVDNGLALGDLFFQGLDLGDAVSQVFNFKGRNLNNLRLVPGIPWMLLAPNGSLPEGVGLFLSTPPELWPR